MVMAADCSRSCQASRPLTDKFSHHTSVGSGALQHEQKLIDVCQPDMGSKMTVRLIVQNVTAVTAGDHL